MGACGDLIQRSLGFTHRVIGVAGFTALLTRFIEASARDFERGLGSKSFRLSVFGGLLRDIVATLKVLATLGMTGCVPQQHLQTFYFSLGGDYRGFVVCHVLPCLL